MRHGFSVPVLLSNLKLRTSARRPFALDFFSRQSSISKFGHIEAKHIPVL
jgi:hypothetical protein